MACFTATIVEAIATTVITAVVKKKEKAQLEGAGQKHDAGSAGNTAHAPRIKLSEKLSWLNMMLWGGSALLLFEHIWHGEVVPWFPFFTAASSPESLQTMLHEIATVGVGMCLLVTGVWVIAVLIADTVTKRSAEPEEEAAV